MWFRLALSLGMSVKRAKQEIDSHEFCYWMAYYGSEPWGETVARYEAWHSRGDSGEYQQEYRGKTGTLLTRGFHSVDGNEPAKTR